MTLKDSVNQFYFDMTIKELRSYNTSTSFPNMSHNTLLYLDVIAYKKDCTASFIADAINVSKSAVTSKVNELIKKGYVQKAQSEQDKRIYFLFLSDSMRKEYDELNNRYDIAYKRVEMLYPKEDIEKFCNILNELNINLPEV